MEYDIASEYISIIRSKIKSGEFEKAIISATKLINYNSEMAEAYYLRGIAKYALNEFIDSVSDYAFAVMYDPKNARALFNMGVAKFQLKQYDDAIKDIRNAQKIFKKNNDIPSIKKCKESIEIIKQDRI